MTKVKICGLTNLEDAEKAEDLGADFLGFVFFESSPRMISPENAKNIIDKLYGKAKKVGLFADQDVDFVKGSASYLKLDLIQLHGSEKPEYVSQLKKKFTIIKSFKIHKEFDLSIINMYQEADFYLFDTFKLGMLGGTGLAFDWKMLEGRSFDKPIFLAGGLSPGNVKKAIEIARPYAVDVASGVESSPGKKNHRLLEEFINAAR